MEDVTTSCSECLSLRERSEDRRAPGHPNLKPVGDFREIVSPYGWRADEQDYICSACGQCWMYETGNYGYGWVMR